MKLLETIGTYIFYGFAGIVIISFVVVAIEQLIEQWKSHR